ncbi:hypothetical protein [Muricoccus radiodurans]|uniref:hypothetical protein n=1 Tax=Muricoccus radiodurans TaxID=2231721 RepID=UPI003CF2AF67
MLGLLGIAGLGAAILSPILMAWLARRALPPAPPRALPRRQRRGRRARLSQRPLARYPAASAGPAQGATILTFRGMPRRPG